MGSFCALDTVTGVSRTVLTLSTPEECHRAHFPPSTNPEVQRSPCPGRSRTFAQVYEVHTPSTALPCGQFPAARTVSEHAV